MHSAPNPLTWFQPNKDKLVIGLAWVLMLGHAFHFNLVFDDAHILFHYSRNLAEGNGLTFSGAGRVEGYSSPLWVLVLAGGKLVGIDIEIFSRILGAFASLACLVITLHLSRFLMHREGWVYLPLCLLSLSGSFSVWIFSGMETMVYSTFLIWTLFSIVTRKHPILVGLLLGALILLRPEGVAFLAPVALYACFSKEKRVYFLRTLLIGWGIFCVLWLFRIFYFHDMLPNTFYAKSAELSFRDIVEGARYVIRFIKNIVGISAVFVPFAFIRWWRGHLDSIPFVLGWYAIAASFAVIVGGDFFPYYRFLAPYLPLIAVSIVAGLSFVLEISKPIWIRMERWKVVPAIVFLLLFLTMLIKTAAPSFAGQEWQAFTEWREAEDYRHRVAKWLSSSVPGDWTIALNPSGIIPYHSRLKSIDMLGLNNHEIAKHGQYDGQLWVGHRKGDGHYVLSRRPEIIFLGPLTGKDDFHVKGAVVNALHLLVSEREILADGDFQKEYMDARAELIHRPSSVRFFIRRDVEKMIEKSLDKSGSD